VKPASPRLAAAMGVVFSVLFVAALVVVDAVPHLGDPDAVYGAFYDGAGNTVVTAVALYLVPLAGIAFLWFVVALRSVLDTLEPAPSAMAHGLNLLSGVVFVALLFAGTAALATPVFLTTIGGGAPLAPDTSRALTALGFGLVFVFSVRGAGMFALTTTTLLRNAGAMPRGVAVVAYLLAAWLLLTATDHPASLLVLPAWVLVVVVVLLRHDRRARSTTATPTEDTAADPGETPDPLPDAAAPETTR
jgi:hypothetical protein